MRKRSNPKFPVCCLYIFKLIEHTYDVTSGNINDGLGRWGQHAGVSVINSVPCPAGPEPRVHFSSSPDPYTKRLSVIFIQFRYAPLSALSDRRTYRAMDQLPDASFYDFGLVLGARLFFVSWDCFYNGFSSLSLWSVVFLMVELFELYIMPHNRCFLLETSQELVK